MTHRLGGGDIVLSGTPVPLLVCQIKNYLLTLSYTSRGRLLISISSKWIGHILKMRSPSHICQANRTVGGVTTVWRQDAHQANADVWTSMRVAILKRNFPYVQVQLQQMLTEGLIR